MADKTEHKTITVELAYPITLDGKQHQSITLQEPDADALMGVNIYSLVQLDAGEILKMIPRITKPHITREDAGKLRPANLVLLGAEIAGFFGPPPGKQKSEQ
ncbi:MAG: phage tail assembly protein [Pseudomonadota bacterium]